MHKGENNNKLLEAKETVYMYVHLVATYWEQISDILLIRTMFRYIS